MNELLTDAPTGDAYSEALTLGPFATVEAIDVQTERADVLFQVATDTGQGGGPQWLDREYAHRPGMRHLERVSGIRFRSKQAGSSAIVNASVTDDTLPLISPRIPLPATGIGDPLYQDSIGAGIVSGKLLGPFDVGDWPALLLGAQIFGGPAGAGMQLKALWNNFPNGGQNTTRAIDVLKAPADVGGGSASTGLVIVRNVLPEVQLQVNLNRATFGDVFAAPCYLTRNVFAPGTLIVPGGNYLLDNQFLAIGAGATGRFLIPPYAGRISLNFTCGGSGPYNVSVSGDDYTDARTDGRLLSMNGSNPVANTSYTFEFAGIAAPMILSATNTGGGVGSFTVSAVPSEHA